jgi:hypothetical protein
MSRTEARAECRLPDTLLDTAAALRGTRTRGSHFLTGMDPETAAV